jgi:hypothetical protein
LRRFITRISLLSRVTGGNYQALSHLAVHHIQTRVAVTNPPAQFGSGTNHWPFDSLGLNVMPGIPIVFKPGTQTDDTKLTAQDLINMVARGDIV